MAAADLFGADGTPMRLDPNRFKFHVGLEGLDSPSPTLVLSLELI